MFNDCHITLFVKYLTMNSFDIAECKKKYSNFYGVCHPVYDRLSSEVIPAATRFGRVLDNKDFPVANLY